MYPHLTALISRLPSGQFITITGAIAQLRNGDVHYPFRQDSDFLYLTGLSVPGLVMIIHDSAVILWREAITDLDRVWGSDKISDDEMTRISGIIDIRDVGGLDLYKQTKIEQDLSLSITDTDGLCRDDNAWKTIVHSLRLIKTPDEIEKIQKAISVSQEAFAHIESTLRPGMYEYEIEAEIARVFRSYHLTEAYPSIVASGPNTCILHYTAHTRQLERGDLVLIDAGAEYMGYASDMTRTLYVSNSPLEVSSSPLLGDELERSRSAKRGVVVSDFSPRQLAVYEAVERVKKIAENTLKPGISLTAYELIVRTAMNDELRQLGLIPLDVSEDAIVSLSRKYYPHRTSHFLGLDVHDVGPRDTILTPGMCLTIEPGIYITEEAIGIRIEDDYLITATGCERLS